MSLSSDPSSAHNKPEQDSLTPPSVIISNHDPRTFNPLSCHRLPVSTSDSSSDRFEDLVTVEDLEISRIDLLSDKDLKPYTRFPESSDSALRPELCPIPVSAEPELFSKEQIDLLKRQVEARVGDIDLQVHIASQTLTFAGRSTYHHLPLHTLTTFSYQDTTMAGPFCGSTTQFILRDCEELGEEARLRVVRNMLIPLMARFPTFTIAFPIPASHTAESQGIEKSQTYRLLTGKPFYCTAFQPRCLLDGAPGDSPMNHMYYFQGPPEYLSDRKFVDILQTIREVRRNVREKTLQQQELRALSAPRRSIQREAVRKLFGLA